MLLENSNSTVFIKAAKEISQQVWEKAPGVHSWQHFRPRGEWGTEGVQAQLRGDWPWGRWASARGSLGRRILKFSRKVYSHLLPTEELVGKPGGRRKGRESPRAAGGRLPSLKEYLGTPRAGASEQWRPLVPKETN